MMISKKFQTQNTLQYDFMAGWYYELIVLAVLSLDATFLQN